ncbi:hypothetical protein [Arthrobacter sp. NA-172]|uniref:hypothetical protein n=1 Tax=Arthrobacter sp. NA-172 TaxID=3367524 RepID=UPI0037543254
MTPWTSTPAALAGRSMLPRERWSEMRLSRVYALADYTDRDSSKDPVLAAKLLRRIGRDIGEGLLLLSGV